MKEEGYYIRISHDDRRNYTGYELKKDTGEDTGVTYCEMNRSGFLALQKEIDFPIKKVDVAFLDYIPFAERNKTSEPLKEIRGSELSETKYFR